MDETPTPVVYLLLIALLTVISVFAVIAFYIWFL